jgi:DNA repair protein SbcC/Rad50
VRLEAVKLHNVGPFADFALDLAALGDARLVAVVGANGSGKSTLLECAIPGALYRETPTRGSLTSLATARDSYVEVRIVNGKPWTIRHSLDAVSGKSEALVLGEDGAPAYADTKVRSFDAWAARTFPPPEVLFSSVFASQAGAGFLGAKPGERKAILLRVLGVERLERLAELARERARTPKATVATLTARLADERARGGDAVALEAALEEVRREAAGADADAEQAGRMFATAREVAAVAGQRLREYEAAERGYRAAEQARGEAARALLDLENRAAEARDVLAFRGIIEAAVACLPVLLQERGSLVEAMAEHDRAILDAERDAREAERDRIGAEQDRAAAERRALAAQEALARADAIEAAARCVTGLRRDVAAAEAEVAAAESALEDLRGRRVSGAEERIGGLRAGLAEIRDSVAAGLTGDQAGEMATDALATDDDAVRSAAELPEAVMLAAARVQRSRERSAKAGTARREAEALAALADRLAADRAALAEAEAEGAALLDRATQAARRRDAAQDRASVARGARADTELPLAAAQSALATAERTAARAPALERAAARLGEIEPRITQARAEIMRLDEVLASRPSAPPEPTDVAAFERAANVAAATARQVSQAVAVAEARLAGARESSERAALLETELSAAELDLADWTRLAADIPGVAAAEIDSAGPELTELANDLLHHGFGPRFTVTIDTQRLSADGKKMLEACEVTVTDTKLGRVAPAVTLSGGEMVIVSEAISLALTTLACRRSGVERPDLIRDESGAALSTVPGEDGVVATRAYISMLRRAADQIGANRVLIVSHNPEVWDLCDARIEVGK